MALWCDWRGPCVLAPTKRRKPGGAELMMSLRLSTRLPIERATRNRRAQGASLGKARSGFGDGQR